MNCPGCPGCPGNVLTCAFTPIQPGHPAAIAVPAVPASPAKTTSRCTEGDQQVTTPITSRAHLTIVQVCKELGVARSTFYDWRKKGTAPKCIQLPNKEIRVRREDLEQWLVSLEEAA